jgi:sugar phosphate isomerase/epimerase
MTQKKSDATKRLAVCSWSLQPKNPSELIEKLQATGVRRVQLALDPIRDAALDWAKAPAQLRKAGIEIVSGMFGCEGEDYTTLETIKLTGGIAPDATWEKNWMNIRATAALAQEMGLRLVTFHAGFLPHNKKDPGFAKMLRRLSEAADAFKAAHIALGLETGQETAQDLAGLLTELNRPTIGVNFDPANMILYDKGDPIAALRVLGPWIRQVHIKDATRTKVRGTWGAEVPAGTGEVDWRAFFSTLNELNYTGDFVIEREAGDQRVADIKTARKMVESVYAAKL